MNRQQRIPHVVGTPHHVLHFQRFEPAGDFLRFRFERALQREIDVGFGFEELVQLAALIHTLAQRVIGLEPTLQRFDFGDRLTGAFRIGPESALRHLVLELREPRGLPLDVKESPGAR